MACFPVIQFYNSTYHLSRAAVPAIFVSFVSVQEHARNSMLLVGANVSLFAHVPPVSIKERHLQLVQKISCRKLNQISHSMTWQVSNGQLYPSSNKKRDRSSFYWLQ